MSFDHADFLPVAEDCSALAASKPHKQALFRAAISRAYYAAFGIGRRYVKKCTPGFKFANDGRDHGAVRQYFNDSGDNDEFAIAAFLDNLRSARNRADYNAGETITDVEATKALNDARHVLAELKRIWP